MVVGRGLYRQVSFAIACQGPSNVLSDHGHAPHQGHDQRHSEIALVELLHGGRAQVHGPAHWSEKVQSSSNFVRTMAISSSSRTSAFILTWIKLAGARCRRYCLCGRESPRRTRDMYAARVGSDEGLKPNIDMGTTKLLRHRVDHCVGINPPPVSSSHRNSKVLPRLHLGDSIRFPKMAGTPPRCPQTRRLHHAWSTRHLNLTGLQPEENGAR